MMISPRGTPLTPDQTGAEPHLDQAEKDLWLIIGAPLTRHFLEKDPLWPQNQRKNKRQK